MPIQDFSFGKLSTFIWKIDDDCDFLIDTKCNFEFEQQNIQNDIQWYKAIIEGKWKCKLHWRVISTENEFSFKLKTRLFFFIKFFFLCLVHSFYLHVSIMKVWFFFLYYSYYGFVIAVSCIWSYYNKALNNLV